MNLFSSSTMLNCPVCKDGMHSTFSLDLDQNVQYCLKCKRYFVFQFVDKTEEIKRLQKERMG